MKVYMQGGIIYFPLTNKDGKETVLKYKTTKIEEKLLRSIKKYNKRK